MLNKTSHEAGRQARILELLSALSNSDLARIEKVILWRIARMNRETSRELQGPSQTHSVHSLGVEK